MLSNPQKALLKRAQREAGLNDADYREILMQIAGCSSSTDRRMNDVHFDKLLAFFEAICWHARDAGQLPGPGSTAVFARRGHWASKNTKTENSRDRFTCSNLSIQIEQLEAEFAARGFGPEYVNAIKERVTKGHTDPRSMHQYRAALERSLRSKNKEKESANAPF